MFIVFGIFFPCWLQRMFLFIVSGPMTPSETAIENKSYTDKPKLTFILFFFPHTNSGFLSSFFFLFFTLLSPLLCFTSCGWWTQTGLLSISSHWRSKRNLETNTQYVLCVRVCDRRMAFDSDKKACALSQSQTCARAATHTYTHSHAASHITWGSYERKWAKVTHPLIYMQTHALFHRCTHTCIHSHSQNSPTARTPVVSRVFPFTII